MTEAGHNKLREIYRSNDTSAVNLAEEKYVTAIRAATDIAAPMGPFQLLDLTGMDISINAMEQIYAAFHQEPRYRPSYLARRQVDAGLFGRKTGQGWYRYRDGVAEKPPMSLRRRRHPARSGSNHPIRMRWLG